ncbi:MAG: 3D domain-containing protein [Pyrinomonadaceae bacterium]|nr:3D domain-containing protein [Pyrinomonadaceae bacterium]
MKNVARGSAFLLLVVLAAGFTYFQPKVEAVTVLASDSQENVQKFNTTDILESNIEKVSFDVEVKSEAAAPKSKGRVFKATAYCLRGRTASGRMVRRGIVAADPRVLRLGTRIHMTAGRYTGSYVVADTGGKIKGNILDIWVPSCAEARRWGRRTVRIRVTKKAKRKFKKRRSKKRR